MSIPLKQLILDHLSTLGQRQLSIGLDELSTTQQESFYAQLKKYDSLTLKRQRDALFQTRSLPRAIEPLQTFADANGHAAVGRELLAQGKVGALILAGGHGSRLGANKPKGMVPLTPLRGKTLFQLFLEKSVAAAKQTSHPLPVAIMTSPFNHNDTLSFLEKQRFFGLKEQNCFLFLQGTLPYLDNRGDWLLEAPGRLAEGADGNGAALVNFFNSGIWAKWKERGIEYITIVPVDNALADPFDIELMGFCHQTRADVILKAMLRQSAEEKVGVVGEINKQMRIIEYTELPEQEKSSRCADGTLRWKVANTGLFCFRMDFIEGLAKNPQFFLPWHVAQKNTEVLLDTAKGCFKEKAKVWKCETFFFDVLNFTTRAKALIYPREEIYAPLKNATGPYGIDGVQKALLDADRRVFKKISGKELPQETCELDPAFYYPTPALLEKWHGREPPAGYVDA